MDALLTPTAARQVDRMAIMVRPVSRLLDEAAMTLRAPTLIFRLLRRWAVATVHAAIRAARLPTPRVMDPCVANVNDLVSVTSAVVT